MVEWCESARQWNKQNEDVKETSGSSSDVIDCLRGVAMDYRRLRLTDEDGVFTPKTNIGRRRLVRGRYHLPVAQLPTDSNRV